VLRRPLATAARGRTSRPTLPHLRAGVGRSAAAKRAMRRFYAVYASAEMMKILPEPGRNDPVRAQSVVRPAQARGGSPAHAGRVRPRGVLLCISLHGRSTIQIHPSSTLSSTICNRARWWGCVSCFTQATFSRSSSGDPSREGPTFKSIFLQRRVRVSRESGVGRSCTGRRESGARLPQRRKRASRSIRGKLNLLQQGRNQRPSYRKTVSPACQSLRLVYSFDST